MAFFREFIRKIGMLARGERFHRDLQEEMRLHMELRAREHLDQGVRLDEARAAAHRLFGNSALLHEVSGEEWRWKRLDAFAQDLRYGARALLRTPGFTAVAVLTLALGIGANTAIFTVVNAVLLRPLAYHDPNRLTTLLHGGSDPVSVANYIDWRDQSTAFETMAAAEYWSPNLTGGDRAEHLNGLQVTQNLLPMLGVPPLMGRLFAVGEDRRGLEHEVILGYGLWRRRFDGDPKIVGKAIVLDGAAYTVVGVMPREFKFAPFWATRAELWVPAAFGDRVHNRGGNSLRVFARLKPGVTLPQARAEVAAITGRLERQYPGSNRGVVVTPLKENVVGKVETPMLMVLVAVGFVLLIACANVAHMLLARTAGRQREIAVRTALGAGRVRVISQFLTENLLLAVMGASAGLLFAHWGTKALISLSPANIPRMETVGMDGRVVLFLLGTTLLTAIAFGLAPALHASIGNLSGALKEGGRGGSDGPGRNRLRGFLVASEFALAFMLLIGAGLMIRSFFALQSVDPGFNPHNVLSMVVSVTGTPEAQPDRRAIFYRELLERLRGLPGVKSAGAINHVPLVGDLWGWNFTIEGRPKPRPGESPIGVYRIVLPGYFETMALPVLHGRAVNDGDTASAPGVVVVNERAAREYWPGENPIGKRISYDADKGSSATWLTIVGVSKDAKQEDWAANPSPEVYRAALQNRDFLENPDSHTTYLSLVVRTIGNPADMANAVKQTVWSFDRNLPVSEVITMDQAVEDANAQPRFEMMLLAAFGAIALLLAAVGIYGVMSYSVSRRTREIGIRISLGASRTEVLQMIVRQGMRQALMGTAAGLVGALLLSRLMSKVLYDVKPADPMTFGTVAVVLGAVALIAICVPARQATRIDPMVALRDE